MYYVPTSVKTKLKIAQAPPQEYSKAETADRNELSAYKGEAKLAGSLVLAAELLVVFLPHTRDQALLDMGFAAGLFMYSGNKVRQYLGLKRRMETTEYEQTVEVPAEPPANVTPDEQVIAEPTLDVISVQPTVLEQADLLYERSRALLPSVGSAA